MMRRLTSRVIRSVQRVKRLLDPARAGEVASLSLIRSLLSEPESVARGVLQLAGTEPVAMPTVDYAGDVDVCPLSVPVEIQRFIDEAGRVAFELGDLHIGTEHVLAAIERMDAASLYRELHWAPATDDSIEHAVRKYRPSGGWPYGRSRGESSSGHRNAAPGVSWDELVTYALLCPNRNTGSTHGSTSPEGRWRNRFRNWTTRGLRRAVFIRRLCLRSNVSILKVPAARLLLVDCSQTERAMLESVGSWLFQRVCDICTDALGLQFRPETVTVVCVGEAADWGRMPTYLQRLATRKGEWQGLFSPTLRVAIVRRAPVDDVAVTLAHEGAHAFEYGLRRQSVLPHILSEALASGVQLLVAGDRFQDLRCPFPSIRVERYPVHINKRDFIELSELFTRRPALRSIPKSRLLARSVLMFLAAINHPDGRMRAVFRKVLDAEAVARHALDAISNLAGVTPGELESAYRAFCLEGAPPRFDGVRRAAGQ